jgi:hypothetical protein
VTEKLSWDPANQDRLCKRLRRPGIDSEAPPGWESIPGLIRRLTNTDSESRSSWKKQGLVQKTERKSAKLSMSGKDCTFTYRSPSYLFYGQAEGQSQFR